MTTGRINQVTASVLTGPGGPHRRASVGRDTTPCFRYRGALAPDGYVLAWPAERTSTSSSIARMPPARAGNADARDNLVSSTVSTLRSAVMRRVVARGQLECVCPWRLAPSEPRSRQELRSLPAVRDVWHHHRRCLLTHLLPSVVLRVDPAGSCKSLKSEQCCELGQTCKRQPTSSDACRREIYNSPDARRCKNSTISSVRF